MGVGDILGILGFLLVIALAFLIFYLYRIRFLLNQPTSIQVSLRGEDGTWHNAIAILGIDTLDIYPTHSFAWLPSEQWVRTELSFEIHRPRGGARVVTIITPNGSFRLAAGGEEMSALVSWMDSSRPSAEPTIA